MVMDAMLEVMATREAAMIELERVPSNNALERTVKHRGPRLAAARAAWPAAQRDR